jgi:hypothetical protein
MVILMYFSKWQACGNDFIIFNSFKNKFIFSSEFVKKLCNRNFGIGADGIIYVLPSLDADFKMRIFNSDGSEAEMCGNGIRCFAKFVVNQKLINKSSFSVETGAGILFPEILKNGNVCVDMGIPNLNSDDIPVKGFSKKVVIDELLNISHENKAYRINCVSMGNPHCVIFTDKIDGINIEADGSIIENHKQFPKKTNVEFVQKISDSILRMKVWERGAGITLACGTGSCAAVVAATLNNLVNNKADVILDGGKLNIFWDKDKTNHVFMTGPAEKVFDGNIEVDYEQHDGIR